MKYAQKILIILNLTLSFNCKAQQVLNSNNYDYYLINTIKVSGIESNLTTIYSDNNFILLSTLRFGYIYDAFYFKKQFIFTHEADTMHVFCNCINNINYYFKNFEFKKGSYLLNFGNDSYEIEIGSDIRLPESLQNILFKNHIYRDRRIYERIYQDRHFKDLMFWFIDLDSVELEPISEKEFWDRDFNPY